MPKIGEIKRDWNSVRIRPSKVPAWKGPTVDGVTQSMIANYLQCRERFRVMHIDGLVPKSEMSIAMEFGNLWHLCEERLAEKIAWEKDLKKAYEALLKKFPETKDRNEIEKIYLACKVEFPIYVEFWKNHPEVLARTPLLQEGMFDILYELPSKRKIKLRGKWDAIDIIGANSIYLQENKSKTSIQVAKIQNQLMYDLQSMTYLVAISYLLKTTGTLPGVPKGKIPKAYKVCGVRYNVIVRALSGGKGTIKQRTKKTKSYAPETTEDFSNRLGAAIKKYQNDYFKKWKVDVSANDLEIFKEQTLHPLLENMLDDFEWWEYCKIENESPYDYELRGDCFAKHISRHWRFPYGCYSLIAEGGYSKLDNYILTGSTLNLVNRKNFFPELA